VLLSYKEELKILRAFADAEVAFLRDGTLGERGEYLKGKLSSLPSDFPLRRRWENLLKLTPGRDDIRRYGERWGFGGVETFTNNQGMVFYQIRIRSFPEHDTLCYLYMEPEPTLIDLGSHLPSTENDWKDRLYILEEIFQISDLTRKIRHLVLTHAHWDHYGFLPKALQWFRPTIYLHALDARVLTQFDERIALARDDLKRFFQKSGVSPSLARELLQLFLIERETFPNLPVDIRLRDGFLLPGGGEVIHTPGHCPGLICIRFGDILFTFDHILQHITPHQSPQSLHPFFGLENYFMSLNRIATLEGIRLGLPSHGPFISDIKTRIQEIFSFHQHRLERLLEILKTPHTLASLSEELFGNRTGYEIHLALLESAAHLEYLHQHGWVRVHNLEEILYDENAVPRYIFQEEMVTQKKVPVLIAQSPRTA
jgi:glyoxylase-like metal-dependent hydrolase (beta-lactamase superfamily II)